MAKGQYLSSYQKGIVNRYYANLDTLTIQKLQEAVSELYLLTPKTGVPYAAAGKKIARHWATVEAALKKTGADPARIAKVLAERKVESLAALVSDLAK